MPDVDFPAPQEVSRPILADHEALIAQLAVDERMRALIQALDEAEAEWHRRISYMMIHSSKEVDQRKVDFTRGYFAGARHYLTGRIDVANERLMRARAEESDASE